jgi:hypothetical protein
MLLDVGESELDVGVVGEGELDVGDVCLFQPLLHTLPTVTVYSWQQ